MTGTIGILNVGAGDTKLIFDPSKPEEMKVAAQTVTDMIRRGFIILVEFGTDKKTGEPLYRRVREFDETTCEYIIAGGAPDTPTVTEEASHEHPKPSEPSGKGRGRPRKAESSTAEAPSKGKSHVSDVAIPAARAKGIAVGRTAGG